MIFGPPALGRGAVVMKGSDLPASWAELERVPIGEAELSQPKNVIARLHAAWLGRRPLIVELGFDPNRLRLEETHLGPVYGLAPDFEFHVERLQFLVWANNYDAALREPYLVARRQSRPHLGSSGSGSRRRSRRHPGRRIRGLHRRRTSPPTRAARRQAGHPSLECRGRESAASAPRQRARGPGARPVDGSEPHGRSGPSHRAGWFWKNEGPDRTAATPGGRHGGGARNRDRPRLQR